MVMLVRISHSTQYHVLHHATPHPIGVPRITEITLLLAAFEIADLFAKRITRFICFEMRCTTTHCTEWHMTKPAHRHGLRFKHFLCARGALGEAIAENRRVLFGRSDG